MLWYVVCAWAAVASAAALYVTGRWLCERDRSAAFRRATRRRVRALASLRAWSNTQALNLNVLWAALQAERDMRRGVRRADARSDASGVVWHRRTGVHTLPRYGLDEDA